MNQSLLFSLNTRLSRTIRSLVLGSYLITIAAFTQAAEPQNDDSKWQFNCTEPTCSIFTDQGGLRMVFTQNLEDLSLKGSILLPPTVLNGQPLSLLLDDGVLMQLSTSVCTAQFCEAVISQSAVENVIDRIGNSSKLRAGYSIDSTLQVVDIPLGNFQSERNRLSERTNNVLNLRILDSIERWRSSWEAGDTETYIASYVPEYLSNDFENTEAWQSQRVERLTQSKNIRVSLSDVKVHLSNSKLAVVHMTQRYASASYKETTDKRLVLVPNANAKWLIQEEISVQ